MATLTTHAPGTFAWPELHTSDQNAAKTFYTGLFGWSFKDTPMGPNEVYTVFTQGGADVCALCTLRPEMKAMGVPPNWMSYVTVKDAAASAKQTAQLGGTVIKDAFDVMGLGNMAVLQDPAGATFCVWEAKSHIGAGVLNEPGALVWTELMTHDTAKAGAFYKSLLGWGSKDMPMPGMTYTVLKRGETDAAGMMAMPPDMKDVPPHWMSHFQTTSVDASAAKAKQLGATFLMEPTDIPEVGRVAVVKDPQGAVFGLFQRK
jgi:predicted enzyme related to lactoylglutathione lyase